ncbi:hypothetical protein FPZ43_10625 [Mucilaginibacter pallidiroseus]|uniref:Cell wall-active antibiotics response LiaF-like C-terminal domain-containing protein n=1 Tax=Mucilaginibacter pallidiroseus TaxID=2599295 RepID=A0A563UDG3_9SPHI|nr:DUF5668 domain-containing protein [Mucilaginibacter pallidiroseus]TWR29398.1 hypothetical protein FPZ43_10625 [Mucilaginibacter pallidiroseus]
MSNNINTPNKTPQSKAIAGLILVAIGGYFLLQQFDFFFIPDSVELWPLILIFIGLYVGGRSNYKKTSGPILIGLGAIFMVTENINNSEGFVWPVALMFLGFWILSKRNNAQSRAQNNAYWDNKYQATPYDPNNPQDFVNPDAATPDAEQGPAATVPPSDDDWLNATAIFGGYNKTIFSKNFRGGDITAIFGGTEIDFTQANINGRVVIELTQVFGGTKIIVPANWQVVADMAAVFAGVDDKRIKTAQNINSDKVLVLKGTSLFAGVDIRSY